MEQTYKPTYIVVYSFPIRLGLQCGSTVCLLASILGVAAGISIYTIVLRAVLSFFMLGIFGWILGMIIEDIDKKAQKKAEQEEDDIQHGITPQLPDSKTQAGIQEKQKSSSKEKKLKEPVLPAGLQAPSESMAALNVPFQQPFIPPTMQQPQPLQNGNSPLTIKKVFM